MTFYEAAVEVLREAGRPLHYKKIAEIAVAQNLLSHVGRTPDQTMLSRLQQEQRKGAGESLIEQFKPGIYTLKKGVDLADAKETMAMHAPPEEEAVSDPTEAPEHDAASASTESEGVEVAAAEEAPKGRRRRSRRSSESESSPAEESAQSSAADGDSAESADDQGSEPSEEGAQASPTSGNEDEDNPSRDRRKRRRGRRGGKNRQRNGGDSPSSEAEQDGEATASPERAASTTPANAADSPVQEQRMPLQIRDPDDLGDVTRSLVKIMEKSRDNADSLRGLARGLTRARVGAIGKVGPAVIRSEIERANLLQSDHGRPPLFEEVKPDVWAVAAASGTDLAASYAALEKWHQKHRKAVSRSVLERVGSLTSGSLATMITLLLDRMGYRELKKHDPLSDEVVTISGIEPRALTTVNIAVRLLPTGKPATREQVIAMRGSLHHFEASEGAIICLSGFDKDATAEAAVPNLSPVTLIDAQTLTEHMVRCGVGVRNFNVAVACLDEPVFRDVVGD